MKTAVCPGSFDPPTRGHLDIIRRAAAMFDMVYVAVLVNPDKRAAFTPEERCGLLREALAAEGVENARVEAFDGLTVDYAGQRGACALVRGVRNGADLSYEQGLEAANKHLDGSLDTVYLLAAPELAFISSSIVKEIASYGREIDGLVPDGIKNKIAERLVKGWQATCKI